MGNVVITGSSKGIGRGLAEQFVRRGHNVVVSGRNADDVEKTAASLNAIGPGRAIGQTCDGPTRARSRPCGTVRSPSSARWTSGSTTPGAPPRAIEIQDLPESLVHQLVDGNYKGTVFGSQVAVAGFRRQGEGALYNMLGGTFEGKRLTPRMGVYSGTKAAVWMLTKYLVSATGTPPAPPFTA